MSNSNWQDPMYAALNEYSDEDPTSSWWDKAICYAYFISCVGASTAPLHRCTAAPLHRCTAAPLHHCT